MCTSCSTFTSLLRVISFQRWWCINYVVKRCQVSTANYGNRFTALEWMRYYMQPDRICMCTKHGISIQFKRLHDEPRGTEENFIGWAQKSKHAKQNANRHAVTHLRDIFKKKDDARKETLIVRWVRKKIVPMCTFPLRLLAQSKRCQLLHSPDHYSFMGTVAALYRALLERVRGGCAGHAQVETTSGFPQ